MAPERRAQWSWAFYDWANSAFATTVIAGFFPIFFNLYWAAGIEPETQTLYQGIVSTIASLAVMLTAPWLGAIADRRGAKKRFLAGFTLAGAIGTAALYLVGRGEWMWAMALSVVARIGFYGGLSFYDSLLVAVAKPADMDRVSAWGYGLGYLGGGLLFLVNVAMALYPHVFGLDDASVATRLAFLMVAGWWVLFSLPLFRNVREQPGLPGAGSSWSELWRTVHALRGMRQVWLFLIAYWLYIDGVDTIIVMAVDFGQKLGFRPDSLIKALLMVQFIGFPAAVAFGWLAGRIGTRNAIFLALVVYAGVTVWAYFLQTELQFYGMAAAIACVQGGIQSLSRSLYARLIPPEKAGEFFGFYNMLGKFAAVLGPLAVGVTAQLTGSPRLSILSLIAFFVVGGVLLWRVPASGAIPPPRSSPASSA